jgi:hypothetical protein
MPQTHYRIVDEELQQTVANALGSYEEAYQIAEMYKQDYPKSTFTIESYTTYTVKGLGRDPDLH